METAIVTGVGPGTTGTALSWAFDCQGLTVGLLSPHAESRSDPAAAEILAKEGKVRLIPADVTNRNAPTTPARKFAVNSDQSSTSSFPI